MRAGLSEVAITPPVGTPLLGPCLPGTGVHGDLHARVLVLCDGEQSAAVVCLDLVGMDLTLAAHLRAEIARQAGIAAVLLNCSHTHSAPFTIPWSALGWGWLDGDGREWRAGLVARVTRAVCQAAASLQEVVLRAGRAPAQVGLNRRLPTPDGVVMRPNPQGVTVPWVDVLRVETAAGEPLALLFSHAAHPVIVHGASTLISADYPGYATAEVRRRLGEDVLPLFAQGCGANINGEPLRGGFEAAEQAGRRLGEAAVAAADEAEKLPPGPLAIATTRLDLALEDLPSAKECQRMLRVSEQQLAEGERAGRAPGELWEVRDRVLCLRDLLRKAQGGEGRALPFEATRLSIGDAWCLLAMTHEVFADYQLWADQVSRFRHTMVLAYTNGCESYIPTDHDLALGGYEAASVRGYGSALRYRHRGALRPGAEARIKEAMAGLLGDRRDRAIPA